MAKDFKVGMSVKALNHEDWADHPEMKRKFGKYNLASGKVERDTCPDCGLAWGKHHYFFCVISGDKWVTTPEHSVVDNRDQAKIHTWDPGKPAGMTIISSREEEGGPDKVLQLPTGVFKGIKEGDVVVRLLAEELEMKLTVTKVTIGHIICGDYTFDLQTGAEIDTELGWGPLYGKTGSRLIRIEPAAHSAAAGGNG